VVKLTYLGGVHRLETGRFLAGHLPVRDQRRDLERAVQGAKCFRAKVDHEGVRKLIGDRPQEVRHDRVVRFADGDDNRRIVEREHRADRPDVGSVESAVPGCVGPEFVFKVAQAVDVGIRMKAQVCLYPITIIYPDELHPPILR